MDAGHIAAGQRVEHDHMAGYGTVQTDADSTGGSAAAKILRETLDEEEKILEARGEVDQPQGEVTVR